MNFKGAGCIFRNESHLLAGYQPRKAKPIVSGLGGKREGEESALVTALRETLEELFEFQTVPFQWIEEIQQRIPYRRTLENGEYISYVYTFEDLERILSFLHEQGASSELYTVFPLNLFSLLFERKQLSYPPEISHLLLLPLVNHPKDSHFIARHFFSDIHLLLTQPSGPIDS